MLACLALEVTVTQSTEVEPSSNTFQEFLAAAPTNRAGFICDPETAGILYINTNKEFVAASMASHPRNKELKKYTVIAQQGNTLAHDTDPILFPVEYINYCYFITSYCETGMSRGTFQSLY